MSEKIVTEEAVFEWTRDYEPAQKGDTVEVVELLEKDGEESAEVINYRDEYEVVPVKKIMEKYESGLLKKLN